MIRSPTRYGGRAMGCSHEKSERTRHHSSTYPGLRVGGCGPRPCCARQATAEFGHELVHQLQILVAMGKPGRGLHVAGGRSEQGRGLPELSAGLDPASIGLAVASKAARSSSLMDAQLVARVCPRRFHFRLWRWGER